MAVNYYVATDGNYGSTANWSLGAIPTTGDNVIIVSGNITSGLDQSAVAIGAFTTAAGYTGTIGSVGGSLKIHPGTAAVTLNGTGQVWIDVGADATPVRVTRTASVLNGQFGVTIVGSAIASIRVDSGSVGVAPYAGQTATVVTGWLVAGSLTYGSGVTATTWLQSGGTGELGCAGTTVSVDAGTLKTVGSGAITTMNNNGGTVYSESSGTITTLNQVKGTTDFSGSRTARTVTSIAFTGGTFILDSTIITLTNKPIPTGRLKITGTPL